MRSVGELLAVVCDERDAVLPFFDAYAQLGSAYDELARMESGVEFNALSAAITRTPELGLRLEELAAARAWLLHMAMAFAAERKEGKWPELLKSESRDAVERLDAAIDNLE
jgi:hypothetical protein